MVTQTYKEETVCAYVGDKGLELCLRVGVDAHAGMTMWVTDEGIRRSMHNTRFGYHGL